MIVVLLLYGSVIGFGLALAWVLGRFRVVQQLDDRVLGERGLATVACVAAAAFLVFMSAAIAQQAWGVAVIYAVMTCWVGYYARRRVLRLRGARSL